MATKPEYNWRLQYEINHQFGSTAQICRIWPELAIERGSANKISALIHLRISPILACGKFSQLALVLSEALGVLPEHLFPLVLYRCLIPNDVDLKAAYPLGSSALDKVKKPAQASCPVLEAMQGNLRGHIAKVLKSVSYEEREIIKLRYGLGDGFSYTLDEVSHIFRVSRERVRQIEAQAVRKLQHPKRSQKLVGFLD